MRTACAVRVRGVVQGVGFRPFVFRLARAHTLAGWVRNGDDGVDIHIEGPPAALQQFLRDLRQQTPPAATIAAIDVREDTPTGADDFTIRDSWRADRPTVRIAPDLPICDDCLLELFDAEDVRYHYPYINCTNCGPRFSVILDLPYDRGRTTMRGWALDERCARAYHDPRDRRFHAQPLACPACGPGYRLIVGHETVAGSDAAIARAARLLAEGAIVAVKGVGGYHLACDACHPDAVERLRARKFRKEKPFALMARHVAAARQLVLLSAAEQAALESSARPIVLARARRALPGVAPGAHELGVMLPYAPLHHLLFAAGAPEALVMTSANRSSEPIAYDDDDARMRLAGLADALLIGERPIARRVEDSVVRVDHGRTAVLRRARGYAPGVVATLPVERPILAVGGDLKNAITLVVEGQAVGGPHIGDLDQEGCRRAFRDSIEDLLRMYDVDRGDLIVAHDAHPQYASTLAALELPAAERCAVQHHRAHIASVLAEEEEWDTPVVGVACDGTGFGDDGAIWGGEFFTGTVRTGFTRAAHLRPAPLPGGDAAAQHPVQAAAGFLAALDGVPDLCAPPFAFPDRYRDARQLIDRGVRVFRTTSMGRLFDTVAALLGFTRAITFEGQAAIWLEQQALADTVASLAPYGLPYAGGQLDYRPLLRQVVADRRQGYAVAHVARAVHLGIAAGIVEAAIALAADRRIETVALSGGVFQNRLLLEQVRTRLAARGLRVLVNRRVPPNDGGLSLGQAALAAFAVAPAR